MSILQAIILGIIQGLTDFLPVSSTAHLTIAGKAMGLITEDHPEAWTAFMAVIQLGTLSAMLIYFAQDLWTITKAVLKDLATNGRGKGLAGYSRDSSLVLYMIIGTLPVAVIGYEFQNFIEGSLTKSMLFIGYLMVLPALFLWLAEISAGQERTLAEVGWKDALVIGLAQVIALIPGASRAGVTITAALFMGLRRSAAARFSFLLSIPALLASGILELYKLSRVIVSGEQVLHYNVACLVVATVAAGVTGYAGITWFLSYLVKNTTMPFVWYRIALGTLILVLIAVGLVSPK